VLKKLDEDQPGATDGGADANGFCVKAGFCGTFALVTGRGLMNLWSLDDMKLRG